MRSIAFALFFVVLQLYDVSCVTTARPTPETFQIFPKTLQSTYFNNVNQNFEGAIVLKSNLPQSVQNQLAATLTSIYQSISDPMQRLQQFQTATTKMYPVFWNVVSNFENITFYSQYYIYLQVGTDRVLAFGLS
ncbi:hypothetical protein FQR65_LT05650 [Abscondita terminalis]|nr:hypothetical protein FQR65_LT05650 [Abscondita terminalis]